MSPLLKFSIITAVPLQTRLKSVWKHSLQMQKHRNWEHTVLEYGGPQSRATWSSGLYSETTVKPTAPLYSRTEALNKGLELASGDVISFLHPHCTFRHNEVLEQVAQIMEDPELDLVYGNVECFGRTGGLKLMKAGNTASLIPGDAVKTGQLPHEECLFVRRDWWDYLGGLETSYQHSAGTARILDLFAQPGLHVGYIDNAMMSCQRARESNAFNVQRWLDEIRVFSKRKLLFQYITTKGLRQRCDCD